MYVGNSTSQTSPSDPRTNARRRQRRSRGVTMMETALATILVGLSVLAVVRLITAVSQQNFVAQETTTALMLADNMREYMKGLAYNDAVVGNHLGPVSNGVPFTQWKDVQSFNGFLTSPPIDAHGQTIAGLADWQQSVTVKHCNPSNFQITDSLATDSACTVDRVIVTVSYKSNGNWVPIATTEWLKSKVQ